MQGRYWYRPMRVVRMVLCSLYAIEVTVIVPAVGNFHLRWPTSRVVELCLALFAICWLGIARSQLGRSFSVTPQARHLVTHVLYARSATQCILQTYSAEWAVSPPPYFPPTWKFSVTFIFVSNELISFSLLFCPLNSAHIL